MALAIASGGTRINPRLAMRAAKTHTVAMFLLPLALLAAGADKAAKPAPAKPVPKAKPAATPAKVKPAAKDKPPEIQPLSHAEKDGFSVLQVAVPDVTDFIAGWKLGGGGKGATTRTIADKPLFTLLIFRGCKADAAGKCDIVADFVIHRPDGTVNDENKGVTVWNKDAPADPKKPYIGDGALGYGVDDEGPFGDYRVEAIVTDRVAGVSVTTEQTLAIAPAKAAATPAKPPAAKPIKPSLVLPDLDKPATDAPAPAQPDGTAPAPADTPAPTEPSPPAPAK